MLSRHDKCTRRSSDEYEGVDRNVTEQVGQGIAAQRCDDEHPDSDGNSHSAATSSESCNRCPHRCHGEARKKGVGLHVGGNADEGAADDECGIAVFRLARAPEDKSERRCDQADSDDFSVQREKCAEGAPKHGVIAELGVPVVTGESSQRSEEKCTCRQHRRPRAIRESKCDPSEECNQNADHERAEQLPRRLDRDAGDSGEKP